MTLVSLASCCFVMFFSVLADAQISSSNGGQQVSYLKAADNAAGLSASELQIFLTDFSANQQVYVTCAGGNTCNSTICDEESVTKVCLPKFLATKSLTAKFVETFSLATAAKKDAYIKCVAGKTPSDNSACVNCGGAVGLPAVTDKDLKSCQSDGNTASPDTTTSSSPRTTGDVTAQGVSGDVTAQGVSALAILALAFF